LYHHISDWVDAGAAACQHTLQAMIVAAQYKLDDDQVCMGVIRV